MVCSRDLAALALVRPDRPEFRGMVEKVPHLLAIVDE